jgi:hypothetical protein
MRLYKESGMPLIKEAGSSARPTDELWADFVDEGLGVDEAGGVETFGEPVVDVSQ